MKRYPCFLTAAAVMLCLAAGSNARADLFAPGATLQVTYTDPFTSTQHTETVPFNPNGPASLLDNGVLSISEQTKVVSSSPLTEWVQFDLHTTNGGPLDTVSNGYFLVNFNNVQLTQSAGWTDVYFGLTDNGVTSGFPNFYQTYGPDPVTPAAGIVNINLPGPPATTSPFAGPVFFPNPPANYFSYWYPYSYYLNSWGTNPNANGFLAGVELQALSSAVPEPSSLALCTAGLVALIGGRCWRRKRTA